MEPVSVFDQLSKGRSIGARCHDEMLEDEVDEIMAYVHGNGKEWIGVLRVVSDTHDLMEDMEVGRIKELDSAVVMLLLLHIGDQCVVGAGASEVHDLRNEQKPILCEDVRTLLVTMQLVPRIAFDIDELLEDSCTAKLVECIEGTTGELLSVFVRVRPEGIQHDRGYDDSDGIHECTWAVEDDCRHVEGPVLSGC